MFEFPKEGFQVLKLIFFDFTTLQDTNPVGYQVAVRAMFAILVFILYFAALSRIKEKLHLTKGITVSLALVLTAVTTLSIPSTMFSELTTAFSAIFWGVIWLISFFIIGYLIFYWLREHTLVHLLLRMGSCLFAIAWFTTIQNIVKAGATLSGTPIPIIQNVQGIAGLSAGFYFVVLLFLPIFYFAGKEWAAKGLPTFRKVGGFGPAEAASGQAQKALQQAERHSDAVVGEALKTVDNLESALQRWGRNRVVK